MSDKEITLEDPTLDLDTVSVEKAEKSKNEVNENLEFNHYALGIVRKSPSDYRIVKITYDLDSGNVESVKEVDQRDNIMSARESFKIIAVRQKILL